MVRSTRGAPGLAALAAAALLVAASCTAAPARLRPSAPRAGDPGGWRRLVAPAAFLAHAAAWHGGRVLLAGDAIAEPPGGALLEIDPSSGAIVRRTEVPRALHVRAVASADAGTWLGGQTVEGRGLVVRSRSGGWHAERLPGGVDDVTAIAQGGGAVWATGTAGAAGVLLARSAGEWRIVARVAASAGFARLNAVAASGSVVLAAGTDGARAVILRSNDAGATFTRDRPPAEMTAASAVALGPSGEALVAGVARLGDARQRGVLARLGSGGRWTAVHVPPVVAVGGVVVGRGGAAVAVAASGHGDVVLRARPPGSWEISSVGEDAATLEAALIAPDGSGLAAGPSGLYRGPL